LAVNCRESRGECQGVDTNLVTGYERVANNIKCIRTTLERLEGGRDGSPDFKVGDIEAERTRSRLNLAHLHYAGGIVNIGHDR
jgi:hypothetical protein